MWNITQCAVQGRGHIKENIPCQDKTYFIKSGNVEVISLADGAGSAKLSHYGAETVTKYICSEFVENFDNYYEERSGAKVKEIILAGIVKILKLKSEELKCEFKDLASTLLVVAIKEEKFIICHIGDGVIGYLKNSILKIASYPENGEFVNTTTFTTSENAIATMNMIKGTLGEIEAFILMSDGTEASFYNKKERMLADIIKKIMELSILFSKDKMEEKLYDSFKNVVTKKTLDDCSLIMIVKNKSGFKGYMKLSMREKIKLLHLNKKATKRQVKRYDKILLLLKKEYSLKKIAKFLHLKPKYTKKYLFKLCVLNLIENRNDMYKTTVFIGK